jgi:DNA polymerase-3 subunit epsilon
MIVKCNCGQDNRIPDVTTPGSMYRCGKCREELHFIVTARATPLTNTVPGTPYPVVPAAVKQNTAPAVLRFAAIDFETADYWRDSACAVGVVKVQDDKIVHRHYELVRPPRQEFVFSWLHGITWDDVCAAPEFGAVWRRIWPFIDDVHFMAAHNAPFDRSVLEACCQASQMPIPRIPFLCTMRLARDRWGIYPTKLEDVCRYLGLPLTHHYALSDAEACAQIVMAGRGTKAS